VHYKVKDGLARIMLLWGCGFLGGFLAFRIINFLLTDFGLLDVYQSKTMASYNVWFIYALVVGQWWIQRGFVERKEDNKRQCDKKELKEFRRKK
jgi:hypothetical protein